MGDQINLESNPGSTFYSLDFPEHYFLICKMGTVLEPTLGGDELKCCLAPG